MLPTSLMLSLVHCIVASNQDGVMDTLHGNLGSNHFGEETYSRDLENYRISDDTNRRRNYMYRQKRTFSLFKSAWKSILKQSLGFVRIIDADNVERKLFLKVGTIDNAVEDFYSLGPTQIKQVEDRGGLAGLVGNQVILLKTADFYAHPLLYVTNGKTSSSFFDIHSPNKIERAMVYVEDIADAKSLLRKWRDFQ